MNENGTIFTGGALSAGFGGFVGSILGNMFGGNGFGWGGGNGGAVVNGNQNTDMLSQQIGTLSQRVGENHQTDLLLGGVNSINAAIGDVNTSMNANARQMQECCCQMKTTVLEQGYQGQLNNERQTNAIQQQAQGIQNTLQNGFAALGYQIQQASQNEQTAISTAKQAILDWLCNSKQLEQATTIQQLRDEVGRANQTQTIINALKTTT